MFLAEASVHKAPFVVGATLANPTPAGAFAVSLDPGAVQIGVRVRNREMKLGLLQDIEFFTHVQLVQQGHNHLGSAALGGNGQFTRLSALMSLGPAPWTECLAKDLDLGIQLIHSIGLVQFIWGLAEWRGIWRVIRRQGSWARTERVGPAPVSLGRPR